MSGEYALARKHLDALIDEAEEFGVSTDLIGEALLNELIRAWQETRSRQDIMDELRALADRLDSGKDF